ncbi:flavin monoamine oxidase family protein [Halobacillus litoralis]|uniref:flavin monoamine oxidase family protein n=1 Tax=Halobacillus litoralis TaxID=45668 RepID=UPI001CFDE7FF|nr:flavin monoamine oxidase family protein [Halobacillus litoralis]
MNNYQSPSFDYPEDFLKIIENGLCAPAQRKRVLILGAGMAGLVAGSLLKQAGHDVTILEANDRIGGRVYTIRTPFTNGNYIDAGAMRLPTNHSLVYAYIKKFRLPTQPFINTRKGDLYLINGRKIYQSDYDKDPSMLDFPVDPSERGKTAKELFLSAVQPFLDLYQNSDDVGKEKLRDQFSGYSMDQYLRNNPYGPSLSTNAVRLIKLLLGIEGFPEFSFLNILIDITFPIFKGDTEFREIKGGNDRLPCAFLPYLSENICFNQKVTRIQQFHDHVRVEAEDQLYHQKNCWTADLLLTTIPFSVFQLVDIEPYTSVSVKKWQSIHEVVNVPSVKIGVEFSCKFWEDYPFGNVVTDYPSRFIYLPSHDQGKAGPGIILASYSWGQNALLFNSLSKKQAVQVVLDDLARIYGSVVYETYMNSVVYNWSRNPYSAGAFTLFTPGQSRDLSDVIIAPEGRIHYAGEHTSSFHGWIEGAVESGIRAACEINQRPR